jgi:phosphoribosyl-AMP cyclohydrolase
MGAMPSNRDDAVDEVVSTFVATLRFDSAGLIPAIAQQVGTGEVLMLAWMNPSAVRETLRTGRATYWSRSRGELWRKGDTSGNAQFVRSVARDCDSDALLITVDSSGPACHTGLRSCFDTEAIDLSGADTNE